MRITYGYRNPKALAFLPTDNHQSFLPNHSRRLFFSISNVRVCFIAIIIIINVILLGAVCLMNADQMPGWP